MSTNESKQADVPAQVFEDFIEAMSTAKVSEDVVARLRQTLLTDKKYTDAALRVAVFGDEA